MDNTAKFIVLMPLYNREEWLAKALDSILMQKVNFSYKILIIDDCSTDKSLEIAKSYQENHKKIEIIENDTNIKLLDTIFKGYERLKGAEYFCVLDPDDYWTYEYKMQEAVDFLDNNPNYTIHATNIEVLDNKGNKKRFINTDETYLTSTFDDYMAGKAVYLSCTQGSIFRNVIFKEGLTTKVKEVLKSKYPQSFRADSFRNALHLEKGNVYFENTFTAVYNTDTNGLWTSLDKKRQVLLNTQALFAFSNYFIERKDFYLGMALWNLNKELELFMQDLKRGDIDKEDVPLYEDFALLYDDIINALTNNNVEDYESKIEDAKLKNMFNTGKMFKKYLRIYIKKIEERI